MQQNFPRAFSIVGLSQTGIWKNIFAYLQNGAGEVRGRSEEGGHELRRKLELFAKGKLPDEELDGLCERLASSPEAMDALARLLRNPEQEFPE
jgi:hypothetical protein